jgi:RHS repeat-associated protein
VPLFEQQRHQSLYIYEDEGSHEPLARVDSTHGGAAEEGDEEQTNSAEKKEKSGTNKVLYFHNDLSGKPEALSSAEQGQLIWRASYKVWGNTITEEWAGEYAQVDMRTVAQNIRFQGQYLDPETGLHYNTFRYYDPDIGRFTTPDPIGLAGGLNLYQYAPNPISWIDLWGWCRNGSWTKK